MNRSRPFPRTNILTLGSLAGLLLTAASVPAAPVPKEKTPIRVLIVSSAGTREFQFLRALLLREQDRKRIDLRICLQPKTKDGAPVADLPGYQKFPSRLRQLGKDPQGRDDALASFDVVIAFDPDWGKLDAGQRKTVNAWVKEGGGLIVVAGPIHTFNLDRPGSREELKPIADLYPVLPADSRLGKREAQVPWRLHFGKVPGNMPFLKLDPTGEGPLAGWDEFFGKDEKAKQPLRGFYGVCPVKSIKPGAVVLATFADPATRFGDKPTETPYLATWAVGRGQVFYISAGEMWRLRQHREAFHERFWIELVRFVSLGAAALKP